MTQHKIELNSVGNCLSAFSQSYSLAYHLGTADIIFTHVSNLCLNIRTQYTHTAHTPPQIIHTRLSFYHVLEGAQVEPANALIEHVLERALELI